MKKRSTDRGGIKAVNDLADTMNALRAENAKLRVENAALRVGTRTKPTRQIEATACKGCKHPKYNHLWHPEENARPYLGGCDLADCQCGLYAGSSETEH